MITNIKNKFFIIMLFLGIYIFNSGYQNLIIINHTDINKLQTNNYDNKKKIESNKNDKKNLINKNDKKTKINFEIIEINVSKGETFSSILKKLNFSDRKIYDIINEIEKFFDLRLLKAGQRINFYESETKEIKKIEINQNFDSILEITVDDNITVKERKLEKNYFQESKEFTIFESLYTDGIKNDLPQNILIKLIKLFSFDLDFQRDIKVNTKVSVSYDFNEIVDNNNIEYIDINYAMIDIDGKQLEYFKFLTNEGYYDYFNRDGKNVKKSILKTPLDGARISSNFGMRKHPISGFNKMHKGVDFAAPKGTPIYAGGNGIIEFIGVNGGYGKYIRIRHNNEYKTAYAHLSKYANNISKGVRVNQGDIIGYVGSTGRSTGPHLHYEIIFQGNQINPLKLKLPSGKILNGKELENFKKEYKRIYANHLNLLYE